MPGPTVAVTTERLENIAMVRLVATIDGLAALDFERKALAELDAGLRLFVIDLEKVRIITSAGIRVLLILRKRLGTEGALVLCGMTGNVKTLLDIAGLSLQLPSVGTRDEAIAYLRGLPARRATASAAPQALQPSALSRLLAQLLGCGATGDRSTESAGSSDLAARIAALLARSGPDKR
jgi:anti-anti-sigma factor